MTTTHSAAEAVESGPAPAAAPVAPDQVAPEPAGEPRSAAERAEQRRLAGVRRAIAEIAAGRPAGAGLGAAITTGPRLTERQGDVLKLTALGQSNKEIARQLDLSPATVKAHIAAASAALGAVNRTEAVMKARQMGLI